MANSEYNYIPMYIRRTINNRPKDVVTAKYWNELFNLLITQGDHTAEAVANVRGAFRINVTYSDGIYSADKTFAEIKAAYDAGQLPYVVVTSGTFDLVYAFASFSVPDGTGQDFVDFKRCLVGEGILETEMLRVYSYTTDSGSNVVKRIDEFKMPTSLKNPNALTFTGGATGSYDGSEPNTVHIPVIPYEAINKNTAARHSHDNKTVLDGITADDVAKWDSNSESSSGVGIQSVKQTVTSTEDGGTNVITVTKTDGTSSAFTVRNGSKGSTGATGAAGKDGYTPVRGTDYWTADDITTIQNYVDSRINTELAGVNTLLGSGIQISFTLGGTTCTANAGETWIEWVGSGYKTIANGMILSVHPYDDEGVIFLDEAGVYALSLDGNTPVRGGDRIISGATYDSMNWGG